MTLATTTPITLLATPAASDRHHTSAPGRFASFRRSVDGVVTPPSWEPSRRPMLAPLPG